MRFEWLTESLWPEFEALFGSKGACAGCWCMWTRLHAREFESGKYEVNKGRMRALVAAGVRPGILALEGDRALAWISVGPRHDFKRLEKSRILKPVDDTPVWSIVCLFIAAEARGRGLHGRLLEAAIRMAGAEGARVLEAYPVEPEKKTAPAFVWTGIASAYQKAGFVEVARRSPTRPIMRYTMGT